MAKFGACKGHAEPEIPFLAGLQGFIHAFQKLEKAFGKDDRMDGKGAEGGEFALGGISRQNGSLFYPQQLAARSNATIIAIGENGWRCILCHRPHVFDESRIQPVVGIQHTEQGCGCQSCSVVSRRRCAGIRLAGEANAAISSCDALKHLPGAVGRTVIDHDRLPVRSRLLLQAGKTFGKRIGCIIGGDEE